MKKAKATNTSTTFHMMPPSPRKWVSMATPKFALALLVLMVAAIFILNLETLLPWADQSTPGDRIVHGHDLNWPTASYFMLEEHATRKQRHHLKKRNVLPGKLGGQEAEIFSCDRSHPRTDVCHMKGDVRTDSKSASLFLYAMNVSTALGEERIKPYTRKWEQSCMDLVHEVRLKSIRSNQEEDKMLACDVHHSVPAVVFTTGGYTGNVYHEFHDGLLPLYITSQHLKGEVVFIIVEFHNWWLTKYEDVLSQMTHYPVINFEGDGRVHCFPEVTVGLHIHDELAIYPALMPHNETIADFRNVLDAAYRQPTSGPETVPAPRLVIIVRNDTRVILNLDEIVELATMVGFSVEICKPDRTTELKTIYWALNSSDVLLGVHGAAMTHFLFMRPGSVFIQVIPLGTKWAAAAYYGEPAERLGLQYIGYEVRAEESSLSDKYDKNDIILTDPARVSQKGWSVVKEIYLERQNVKLSLPRFRKTLLDAKAKALAFRAKQKQQQQQKA